MTAAIEDLTPFFADRCWMFVLLARDALERFRLDVSMLRFDLEATRREREALKMQIQD